MYCCLLFQVLYYLSVFPCVAIVCFRRFRAGVEESKETEGFATSCGNVSEIGAASTYRRTTGTDGGSSWAWCGAPSALQPPYRHTQLTVARRKT